MSERSWRRRAASAAAAGALGLLAAPCFALFSDSDAGTSAAPFLRLGAGAREVGMGEAAVAAVGDAASMHYNPAGLALIPHQALVLSHADHLAGSSYQFGAYGLSLGRAAALGVSFKRFSAGGVPLFDEAGAATGQAEPSDLAISLGGAYRLSGYRWGLLDGAAFGLTGTYVRSELVREATAFTGGFGVMTRAYGKRLRLGLSADHLVGGLKFDRESDPLPAVVRVGAAYLAGDDWLLSAEADLPRDASPYLALGTGVRVGALTVRAGYNTFRLTTALSGAPGEKGADLLDGVSGGFGLSWRSARLDYALVPFGELGQSHRVSLSFAFSPRAAGWAR